MISDRNKSLVSARDVDGVRFSELARRFAITRCRAVQIYDRTKELMARAVQDGDTIDTSRLSVRAKNALKSVPALSGSTTMASLREWLAGPGMAELPKVRNIGRHTAAEIEAWASASR